MDKIRKYLSLQPFEMFILAALLFVFTTGATWGVYILLKIGSSHSFTTVSVQDVNAHGHAQIFGWIGLLVMAFTYRLLPQYWQTKIRVPSLTYVILISLSCGIIIRTVGMTLHGVYPWAIPVALFGGILEVLSVTLFVCQIIGTFLLSRAPFRPYMLFMFTALTRPSLS